MSRNKKTFIYFAYCVNMLSSRMECCVGRSVARKGLGKLEGHRLLFGSYNKVWEGCLPSLVKAQPSEVVWGSLWEIEDCLRSKLDSLQGVDSQVYQPVEVDISALKGRRGTFKALTYKLIKEPESGVLERGKTPMKHRPSKLYLEELMAGAEEACLPTYYRKWLRTIPHNGYTGSVKPNLQLNIEQEPIF